MKNKIKTKIFNCTAAELQGDLLVEPLPDQTVGLVFNSYRYQLRVYENRGDTVIDVTFHGSGKPRQCSGLVTIEPLPDQTVGLVFNSYRYQLRVYENRGDTVIDVTFRGSYESGNE